MEEEGCIPEGLKPCVNVIMGLHGLSFRNRGVNGWFWLWGGELCEAGEKQVIVEQAELIVDRGNGWAVGTHLGSFHVKRH